MTRRPPAAALAAIFLAAALFALSALTVGGPAAMAQDAAPAQGAPFMRVAAVGDIMMGTENLLPPDGAKGFFADMAPYVKGYDVILGNLEGPLTNRGAPTKKIVPGRSYCFRTPPSYGQNLKDAGFNVMTLANNHANDYGPEGKAQTIETLSALGIAHTGAEGQITIMTANNGREVAVIGLAPNRGCQDVNDIDGAVALVKKALAEDPQRLVLVTFHGGAEGSGHMAVPLGAETYLGENRGALVPLSHALIDAGAAAVIGHGPHVPRALEIYKGHLIAYSLGNFATAAGINVSGATGLAPLLLLDLAADGTVTDHSIVSFRQRMNQGPKLDKTGEAEKVIGELTERLAKALAAAK
jgi:poly-gamma-glutamate capsule biosynthesis protein CapA/YwtB (metallophosphatase superfamily)